MNTNKLQRAIKGIGLALSLMFGFMLLSGTNAQAQYRDRDDQQDRQYNRRDNRQEDHHDRRDNRRENRRDNDDNDNNNGSYNNNNGYYGNNGGYNNNGNNGYYGNNGYGNNVYQLAQQNGYNDGLRKGAEDAREGHNNPQGTREYRNATNGYDRSYGNRSAYQQAYRQAFLQGFSEGFDQNYNNNGYGNRNRPYRSTNGAGNVLRQIIFGQ